jgi:hypothetical protein
MGKVYPSILILLLLAAGWSVLEDELKCGLLAYLPDPGSCHLRELMVGNKAQAWHLGSCRVGPHGVNVRTDLTSETNGSVILASTGTSGP